MLNFSVYLVKWSSVTPAGVGVYFVLLCSLGYPITWGENDRHHRYESRINIL